jgi:hypothetical protein
MGRDDTVGVCSRECVLYISGNGAVTWQGKWHERYIGAPGLRIWVEAKWRGWWREALYLWKKLGM